MINAYTPGPWSAESEYGPENGYDIKARDEQGNGLFILATAWYDPDAGQTTRDTALANAFLITAAPKLLAACISIHKELIRFGPTDEGVEEAMDAVSAAVIEATGKSPRKH